MRARVFGMLALALWPALPLVRAADVTGTVTGIIKDASGAVVPGAEVVLTNIGTNATHTTLSDETGQYALRALPVGVYALTAERRGFKKFETQGIRVQVNEAVRVDVTLTLGEMTETVSVSGLAVTVDTQTPTLKTVVDQQRIVDHHHLGPVLLDIRHHISHLPIRQLQPLLDQVRRVAGRDIIHHMVESGPRPGDGETAAGTNDG